MRTFSLAVLSIILFSACNYRTIKGNGHLQTENRNISKTNKIKLVGSFDVELTPGGTPSVTVEADDNLLPYIITEIQDGKLVIKYQNNTKISSENDIKIKVTTPILEEVSIAGSGNITGKGKFSGGDQLKLNISGSGDIHLQINTPSIEAKIAGSGNIKLEGETQKNEVHISGQGDYEAANLLAENAEVHIAGSGNVKIYAANSLDVHIAGSGDVYYKGNPKITKKIAGSGTIAAIN